MENFKMYIKQKDKMEYWIEKKNSKRFKVFTKPTTYNTRYKGWQQTIVKVAEVKTLKEAKSIINQLIENNIKEREWSGWTPTME